jgi:branched-subunit amino acid transport protein AzlD
MEKPKFNWATWVSVVLSIFAFLSYPLLFVNWPVTRDFPWANIALFVVATFLLIVGIRRAFAPGRRRLSKIFASLGALLSVLVLGMFILVAFIGSRWLPASTGAPQVNQKAPAFTLNDTNNKRVSLTELLSQPVNGKPTKGVLLIFYRGYW